MPKTNYCCACDNNKIKFTLRSTTDSNSQIVPLAYVDTYDNCNEDYIVQHASNIYNPIATISGLGNAFFSLSDDDHLLTYSNNLVVESRKIIGIASGQKALAIDFRPKTNQLYLLAYNGLVAQQYILNLTESCQVIASPIGSVLQTALGAIIQFNGKVSIDFNPVADRLRIVTTTGQNYRVNPDTGITIIDGNLQYAITQVVPSIGSIAYTNSVPLPTTTLLYGIDSNNKSLVTINPPNAGTVNLVGSLGVNFTEVNGFDIQGETNIALAILKVNGKNGLYSINLATGAATFYSNHFTFNQTSGCNHHDDNQIRDLAIALVPADRNTTLKVRLLNNEWTIFTSEPVTLTVINPALLVQNGIHGKPNGNTRCKLRFYHNSLNRCDRLSAEVISLDGSPVPTYISASISLTL